MIDVIVSGGLNLTVEDTGDIINVTVEVAAPIAVEVVVGVPTKEGIVGLAKSDTPEFADVVIPDIAEEASYTASAWAWLTGIFGAVTGSVKAMLVGLVERVVELEDDVIYEGTIEEDVASITISVDKKGMPFSLNKVKIIISGEFTKPSGFQVRINNRKDEIYRNYDLDPSANIAYRNRFYCESSTNFVREKLLLDIIISHNEAFVDHRVNAIRTDNVIRATNRGLSYTDGLNADVITSVTIFSSISSANIKAGAKITIRK